jgi:hypothetical protein
MALIGWIGNINGNSFHKGTGIKREEIKTPCLLRNDGPNPLHDGNFSLLKTPKLGNVLGIPFVKYQQYFWGHWSGPIYDRDRNSPTFGELLSIGEFEKTSTAQESNWNGCNYNAPRDERTGASPDTTVLDPFEGTQTLIDQANSFSNSDNTTRNLIIAAVAIGILTLVITINVK